MAPKRSRRGLPRPPVTSATAAARAQLVQADVLGLAATQQRVGAATKGTFGTRSLRQSGDLTSYLIGSGFGGSKPRDPVKTRLRKQIKRRYPDITAQQVRRRVRRHLRLGHTNLPKR